MTKYTPLLVATMIAAGCGGKGGSGLPSNGPLTGSWQRQSGGLFSGTGSEILQYLSLAKDGTGESFAKDSSNILGCNVLHYSVVDAHTMTLDDGNSGGEGASSPHMYGWVRSGATLTLTDGVGNQNVFTKVDSVPASATCVVTTAATTYHPTVQRRGYYDGLVYDGTSLWYEGTDEKIHAVNPGTGAEGAALVLSSGFSSIHASVGGNFWATCNCGGDGWQLRSGTDTKLDQFYWADIGVSDNIETTAGAWDGSNLWVDAYDFTDQRMHFFRIDPAGAGSVVSNFPLEQSYGLEGITFMNGVIWTAYGGDRLLQFDPANGVANVTVKLPPGSFTGVAQVGTDVFVIGDDDTYHTVIVKLAGMP